MTIVVAPICGPILGGWISDNIHWGWIFFINVPIGLAVVLISWKILEGRESKTSLALDLDPALIATHRRQAPIK